MQFNGVQSLLYTEAYDSTNTIVATTSSNSSAFPTAINLWQKIFVDLNIPATAGPLSKLVIRLGYPFQATTGTVWLNGISAIRVNAGIPHGACAAAVC